MNAVSLFSGIDGIGIAARAAGFNIIAQIEIDPFCRDVLEHHREYWPDTSIFSDVRDFGAADIARPVDLIFGGFPCQPFSIAGNRKGADDSRNMWPEFARIVGEIRPRAVLLENVPAICKPTTDANGRRHPAYALTVVGDLAQMGYECRWGIVSARDAGAGHLRERWWLVGYAKGTRSQAPINAAQWAHTAQKKAGLVNRFKRPSAILGNTQNQRRERHGASRQFVSTGRHRTQKPARSGRPDRAGAARQPRMVAAAHGLSAGLDGYKRPALINELPNCAQFDHEPARTVSQKVKDHAAQIKAIGNAVFVPTAYALMREIYEVLK